MTSEDIAEVAVVGIPDTLKGQIPLGLCVLKHGRGLQLFTMFDIGYCTLNMKNMFFITFRLLWLFSRFLKTNLI